MSIEANFTTGGEKRPGAVRTTDKVLTLFMHDGSADDVR